MVQAVGLLLFGSTTGLTAAGVGLTTATGALTGVGVAVNIAAGLAISSLTQQRAQTPNPEDVLQTFQSPASARLVHIGKAKVGGSMLMPPRVSNDKLYILVAQMHGELDARGQMFLDGREVTLHQEASAPFTTPAGAAGGYVSTDQYVRNGASLVQVLFRDGTPGQTAYPELMAAFPDWTAQNTLEGIATALIIAEAPPAASFNGVYPNRTPEFTCEGDWLKVLDPRTGVTASSENPIVHLRDYMLSPDGMGLSADRLNDSFLTAMNDCDEVLSTGARYKIGGTYSLLEPAESVISAILATCDGEVFRDREGRWGVRVGTKINATVSFTTEDLHSVLDWSNGKSLLEGYTSLKPSYTEQSLGFASETIDPWVSADLVTRYRQETYGPDPSFTMVPNHVQARFLAKIKTNKDNPTFTGVLRYDLRGLKAVGEEYINVELSFDEFGVDYSGPVRVDSITLAGGSITRTDSLSYVDIAVSVIDPDTYSRSIAEEGTAPTQPASDDAGSFPIVVNFAAGASGVQTAQNAYTAGIGLAWDNPAQTSLSSVIRYSITGQEAWQEVDVPSGVSVYQITGLQDGALYDVGHAWRNPADTVSEFTDLTGVSASSVVGSPTPPQSLGVTDLTGGEGLVSFMASASNTTWKTEVLRDGVAVYSQVTAPSASVSFSDIPGAGSYTYTAQTIDVGGNVSPVLATTPAITIIT